MKIKNLFSVDEVSEVLFNGVIGYALLLGITVAVAGFDILTIVAVTLIFIGFVTIILLFYASMIFYVRRKYIKPYKK